MLVPAPSAIKAVGAVVKKIEQTMAMPLMLEQLRLDVRASMGIAIYPEHDTDPDTLLQRADMASMPPSAITRALFERLGDLGCDPAQGYYLTQTLAADAFDAWVEETRQAGAMIVENGCIRLVQVGAACGSGARLG
ncbi:diguanylate cyclase [Thiobacter sp. AK1]|uniref:Diguanylate cyclase n=1 Tax=Thiobacter aerophilum TaxID=3121275 RepID=A0ABV0EEP6_9BURK